MTAAEQQVLFEKTRARIQGNLNAVTDLARTCRDPNTFFPQFLRLVVNSLSAEGGAVWMRQGEQFVRLAEENFATSQYENAAQRVAIDAILAEILRTRKPHIIASAEQRSTPAHKVANITSHPFFYSPVSADEKWGLVLQVWLKEGGDPKSYHDISSFLATWCQHAESFLNTHQQLLAAVRTEELSHLVAMQAALLGELDPKEVTAIVVNYTSDLLRADLACVFLRRGKGWRLAAASNQEVVDEKSQQTRRLTNFVSGLELADRTMATTLPADDDAADEKEKIGFRQVIWKLVGQAGRASDFLICAFRHDDKSFGAEAPVTLDRIAEAAGKSLDAAHHFHAIPLRPILSRVARVVHEWRCHRRKKITVTLSVLAALACILFLIPVPLKVTAECSAEPTLKSLAVAEAAGKIRSVYVEEGQVVKQGDLLAKLDDDDYVTQLAVSAQQKLRWEVEAARAQTAGEEPERKLAEINAQREAEAIKRLEYLRTRTEIRSPITGVVLTKDLEDREGEPLQIGAAFCEIADAGDYELVLRIKQNDIGDLLTALKTRGDLAVDFILYSHVRYHLTSEIQGVEQVSQLPEIQKDHSYFVVRVPFPKGTPLDKVLKPGYTGKAKIRIGSSNLMYAWFRPFLNYWRVEWGV